MMESFLGPVAILYVFMLSVDANSNSKNSGENIDLLDVSVLNANLQSPNQLNAFLIIPFPDEDLFDKYSRSFKKVRFIAEENLNVDPEPFVSRELKLTLLKFRITRTMLRIASILHITAEHPEKKNVTILSTRFNIYKSRQRISLFFDNNIFEAKLIFAQNLAKSSPTPLYTDLNSMFNSKICNAELESSTIARTENEISNKSEKYPTHFFNFKNNGCVVYTKINDTLSNSFENCVDIVEIPIENSVQKHSSGDHVLMDHGKFFVNIQRISMNNNHDEKNSFQDIYKSLYKYMQASNRGFFFSGVDSSRLLIPLLNNIAPVLYKIQSDEFDPTLKSSAISNFTFEQVIFFKSCPVCKIFFFIFNNVYI